jgi:hypothetical protein
VLLGFQINEWASERQARSERETATARLLVDLAPRAAPALHCQL